MWNAQGLIHLRHKGNANTAFWDGHAENLDVMRIKNSIRRSEQDSVWYTQIFHAIDKNGQMISLP